MRFSSPLPEGRLIRRYKRFLADIACDNGQKITAYCPNTGSLLGLVDTDLKVAFSHNPNPKRKFPYTWEMAFDCAHDGAWVGINTGRCNDLIANGIRAGFFPEFVDYPTLNREVRYGDRSRVDIQMLRPDRPPCFLEVKYVHLVRDEGRAEFPDSVTTRGTKHLRELARVANDGGHAMLVYCIQRNNIGSFSIAADIDPAYASAEKLACEAGVEMRAVSCNVSPIGVELEKFIPVVSGSR